MLLHVTRKREKTCVANRHDRADDKQRAKVQAKRMKDLHQQFLPHLASTEGLHDIVSLSLSPL